MAVGTNQLHGVSHEDDRHTPPLHLLEVAIALALKTDVSDRQCLVDDKYVGVHVDGGGEGQADIHTAGIGLDRPIDVLTDRRKRLDLGKFLIHAGAIHAHDGGIEIHVLASGKIGIESRAEFEKRRDATIAMDGARGRRQCPAKDFEEGRLPRSIGTNEADRLTPGNLEIHVRQGGKHLVADTLAATEQLHHAVDRPAINPVILADVLDTHRDRSGVRGHRRTRPAFG